ncbi:hypothetical protein AKO1_007777 [Acrasis kona]|uniref:Oxysterol-binding protein n=1 Tax=Acrasis kona TaxID=1008807 RepID=A0AAW2YRF9_9EUKA
MSSTPDIETLREQSHIYAPDVFFKPSQSQGDSGSVLYQFITSLRPGMDLSSMMCPMFAIRPVSFLELLAVYTQPNKSLLKTASEKDPEKCIINIVEWLISTLTITPQNGLSGIKPYNPVLGEQFHCKWLHDDGSTTTYDAEQISHHPPICSIRIHNEVHGFTYNSTGEMKARFRGNYADSSVDGQHILTLPNGHNYDITWPCVAARGLIWGTSRIEHSSNLQVTCKETGYSVTVCFDYSDHKFDGHIFKQGKKTHQVAGSLSDSTYVKNLSTKNKTVILETKKIVREKYVVAEVYDQKPNESRRVWHSVTFALKTGDLDAAGRYKNEVEEAQRVLARERKEKQEQWVPKMFQPTDRKSSFDTTVYEYSIQTPVEGPLLK